MAAIGSLAPAEAELLSNCSQVGRLRVVRRLALATPYDTHSGRRHREPTSAERMWGQTEDHRRRFGRWMVKAHRDWTLDGERGPRSSDVTAGPRVILGHDLTRLEPRQRSRGVWLQAPNRAHFYLL